jgi:hypothetical protein
MKARARRTRPGDALGSLHRLAGALVSSTASEAVALCFGPGR